MKEDFCGERKSEKKREYMIKKYINRVYIMTKRDGSLEIYTIQYRQCVQSIHIVYQRERCMYG